MNTFERTLTTALLLASTVFVVSNIKVKSFAVDQNVFIESASAMEMDLSGAESFPDPLIIEKVIQKKVPVREIAVASSRDIEKSDDLDLLYEGKYSFEGLTFHVSNNGSVCQYSEDEVNGTLVTEHIYDTHLRDKSKAECL